MLPTARISGFYRNWDSIQSWFLHSSSSPSPRSLQASSRGEGVGERKERVRDLSVVLLVYTILCKTLNLGT